MILGFTGTQDGMTDQQRETVEAVVSAQYLPHMDFALANVSEVNHGDCIGADENFHMICRRIGVPIVIHPPENESKRAFCEGAALIHDPLPYLDRNRVIVVTSDWLLATPKQNHEPAGKRAGGTWYTVRFARTQAVPVLIVWPDGTTNL